MSIFYLLSIFYHQKDWIFIWFIYVNDFQGYGKDVILNREKLYAFIQGEIDQHREYFNPDQCLDFIDLYLKQETEPDGEYKMDCK